MTAAGRALAGVGVFAALRPTSALVAALHLAGCDLEPLAAAPAESPTPPAAAAPDGGAPPHREACAAIRRLPSGTCCPPWNLAQGTGQCALRGWTTRSAALGGNGGYSMRVAMDGRGRGVATWRALASCSSLVMSAVETSTGSWHVADVGRLVASLGNADPPAVAAGPDGSAVVVWSQGSDVGTPLVFAAEVTESGRWTVPAGPHAALSPGPMANEARVVTAASGESIVAWSQLEGSVWRLALARRSSATDPWQVHATAAEALSPAGFDVSSPAVAMADSGEAMVSWSQSVGGPAEVFVSDRPRLASAFAWPVAAGYLSPPGLPADPSVPTPAVALGPRGEAAVAWTQQTASGGEAIFLATRDDTGRWTKPPSVARPLSRAHVQASAVRVAFGSAGDLYVVWLDAFAGGVLQAAHRAADGTWLDRGDHPVRLSSPGATAQALDLATGSDGTSVVVWIETSDVGAGAIFARRSSPGAPWANAELLSGQSTSVGPPSVAIGGPDDRVLVSWPFDYGTQATFASID